MMENGKEINQFVLVRRVKVFILFPMYILEPVSDNAGIYIAVGTTLGVLLVALIIGILIGTVLIFSFNRFKGNNNNNKFIFFTIIIFSNF